MAKVDLSQPQDIPINAWKGLYSRGMEDSTPAGYFTDCLNLRFNKDDCLTRNGLTKLITHANIVRAFPYRRLNEASRIMYLDSSGNFYDSLYPNNPLVTNAAYTDFAIQNIANRLYVTFHNGIYGIDYVYVYEGAGPGTLRYAAGSAPTSFTLGVATSGSAGNVEAGIHLFAVAFESSSGFISAPGPELFAVYTAPGDYAVDFSALPIGPAGTVARWLLATKAIQADLYTGNQYGYEMFYIPTGRVGDNTSTTATAISFFDDDLQDSADDLFDIYPLIPAGIGFVSYVNRLVLWGVHNQEHTLFVSDAGFPESFNQTTGLLPIDESSVSRGIRNCIVWNNLLYIGKSGFYTTQALDSSPSTWGWVSMDPGVGADVMSISTVFDTQGSNNQRFFVASVSGCYIFQSGFFQKPEFSFNIENIWKRINKNYFYKVQVVHDVQRSLVFISVPLDNATNISHVLVANYDTAVSPLGFIIAQSVNWSIDGYVSGPSSMFMDLNSSNEQVMKLSYITGNIYEQNFSSFSDDGTKITSQFTTYLVQKIQGWVHQFTYLHARIVGVGDVDITMSSEDNAIVTTLDDVWTLTAAPGKEFARKVNFTNEKMKVKIGTNDTNGDWFQIRTLLVKAIPKWATRPNE
jgi:hypothetical protein